jgi:hypothetical protein
MCLSHTRRRKNYSHYYDLDPFIANGEIIAIDDKNDVCSICGGDFKHSKRYTMTKDTPKGLKEVVFKTAHNGCLKIMARIQQKRQEICDLEFQIYLKHSEELN